MVKQKDIRKYLQDIAVKKDIGGCDTGDWSRGLTHEKRALYRWATSPAKKLNKTKKAVTMKENEDKLDFIKIQSLLHL